MPGGSAENPLKARWLGVVGGVGIHGTALEYSIGTRASHGCIRMRVADVIDLYPRAPIGTRFYQVTFGPPAGRRPARVGSSDAAQDPTALGRRRAGVLDVIQARDVADVGEPDFTLDDLQADWARPGLALEHDARVAVEPAASAATRSCSAMTPSSPCIPATRAKGTAPCCVAGPRRGGRARHRGAAAVRVGGDDGARRHLSEAGYEPAQRYFRLRADLADVPPFPTCRCGRSSRPTRPPSIA